MNTERHCEKFVLEPLLEILEEFNTFDDAMNRPIRIERANSELSYNFFSRRISRKDKHDMIMRLHLTNRTILFDDLDTAEILTYTLAETFGPLINFRRRINNLFYDDKILRSNSNSPPWSP
jgi:hypothetical protein